MKGDGPGSAPGHTPGCFPGTASPGYQTDSDQPPTGSDEQPDSNGCRRDSDEPPSFEEASRPGSASEADGFTDPYKAFSESAAKVATEKELEKKRRDPALWLPGSEDLDQDLGKPPDSETGFSRDSWSRGNPQVNVRLRPLDFDRLRRAAHLYGVRPTTLARMMVIRGVKAILEAELRKAGEELRDRDRY